MSAKILYLPCADHHAAETARAAVATHSSYWRDLVMAVREQAGKRYRRAVRVGHAVAIAAFAAGAILGWAFSRMAP